MSKKQTSKRQVRKSIIDYFDNRCRIEQFDVRRDLRLMKGRSRLRGILTALGVYLLGFAVSYYAWSRDLINYELFYKVTWVILMPATVVGILVWLLAYNREENDLRVRLAAAMRNVEADDGFLWRFAPLLQVAAPTDYDTKTVVNKSRERQLAGIEPDDYAQAMLSVHALLQQTQQQPVSSQALTAVESNISVH